MDTVLQTKVCTKCKIDKPLTEYFIKDKRSGRRFTRCKDCHNAHCLAHYYAGGEERRRKNREYAHRQRQSNLEAARVRERKYREQNREHLRELARRREATPECKAKRAAYRAANRDKRQAFNVTYRQRMAEAIKASSARYRQRLVLVLRERQRAWREDHPEEYREIHRRWKQANKDMVNACGHRRRARILSNGGTYTASEWRELKQKYGGRCLMCGATEDVKPICVDHVVPIARGGLNVIGNIQPLCRSCNSIKHIRDWDFREESDVG